MLPALASSGGVTWVAALKSIASEVDSVVACIIAAYRLCVNSEDFADYASARESSSVTGISDYGVLVEQGHQRVDVVFEERCASVG